MIGDINFKTVTFKDFAKNFDDPRVKQLEKELQVAKQAIADVEKEKEKELEKEKLEKQTYKDALAEKEYQAFQKDRLKAQNGSGSSTTQILW